MPTKQPLLKTNNPPVVTVDVERYDHLLENAGLSTEHREAVLQQLWNLIVAVIDLGFRVEPSGKSCGQDSDGLDLEPVAQLDRLSCEHDAQSIDSLAAGAVDQREVP